MLGRFLERVLHAPGQQRRFQKRTQNSGESGRGKRKVFMWRWGREEPPAHSSAVHGGAGSPGAGTCGVGPGDRSLGAGLQAMGAAGPARSWG